MKNFKQKSLLITALFILTAGFGSSVDSSAGGNNSADSATAAPAVNNGGQSKAEAHKAVVKIYTYYEDSSYMLSLAGTGSGVIISPDGAVLTNHHVINVVDDFGDDVAAAYKICLTRDTTGEPDCFYSAGLLAKDKDKDIALLKIKNVPGLSNKINFDYLERIKTKNIRNGEAVQALGYPAIGGKTITSTAGTISGTTEKYSLEWIKTDANISFGSSGGALINNEGNLLGITSMAYSDMLSSLGYILDITSINDWIDNNLNNTVQLPDLLDRINNLIVKQSALRTSDVFQNDLPRITIIKDSDWDYKYENENEISINNNQKNNGGMITIRWESEPVLQKSKLDFQSKILKLVLRSYAAFMPDQDIIFSGKPSKKISQNMGGYEMYTILAPSKNYLVSVVYAYGENDVDQAAIDKMLDNINISDEGNNFSRQVMYEHHSPYFKITVPDSWALQEHNSASDPVSGFNSSINEVNFNISIKKLKDSMKNMNNQEYFDYFKNNELVASIFELLFDLTPDRYYQSTNYKINNQLDNVIFYKYRFRDSDDGDKAKAYAAGFRIKLGDKIIIIGFNYYGEDEEKFEQYLKDFQNNILANFIINRNSSSAELTPILEKTMAETINIQNKSMYSRLKGKIILKVEDFGRAYYIHPSSNKMYYLGRPKDAFAVMREQGVGITNADLYKIPIGISKNSGVDSDEDGLPDYLEQTLGLNSNNADTDGDGYKDKEELSNGYSPWGAGKQSLDNGFAKAQAGKIFLQVEKNGEAWYVNPNDSRRYFLGRPADAFNIMKNLGLGVSNGDFNNLK